MNVYPTYNCNNTNLILKRNPPQMKQNKWYFTGKSMPD